MWSHYAENHKGLVFEFYYTHTKLYLHEFLHKVNYVKELGLLSHAVLKAGRKNK